jgi:hypothetical protein
LLKLLLVFLFDRNIGFLEKVIFFAKNWQKIAENRDHKIGHQNIFGLLDVVVLDGAEEPPESRKHFSFRTRRIRESVRLAEASGFDVLESWRN